MTYWANSFQCPPIRAQVALLQDRYQRKKISQETMMVRLRELTLREGEWLFEQEVGRYPHAVELRFLDDQYVEDAQEWARSVFDEEDLIYMPNSAMGRHKDKWSWVYFRDPRHARLFKLRWG